MGNDEIAAESKFLTKNYKAFLHEHLEHFRSGADVHPPPALRAVFELMLDVVILPGDEITYADLIAVMNMTARFMAYLERQEINYEHLIECACGKDGGDNR